MSGIFTAEERRLAEALLERKLVTRSQLTQCEQILERKRGRGEEESLGRLLVVKRFADELSIQMVTDQLKSGPEPSVPGFALLEELGHRTYRARQESVGRTVALKLFQGKDESFLREIRRAAAHIHKHLVTVYDAGRHGGSCYLVMELVEGDSFESMIRQAYRPPQRDLVEWGIQAAEALDYLGSKDAHHGDLNARRFLVQRGTRAIKILGAGIPRTVDELRNDPREIASVPPEVLSREKPPRLRGDLYSLGATLFEVATGQPPYEGASVESVLAAQRDGRLRDARALNPDLSVPFCMILARCLSDRSARYHGPRELIRDLKTARGVVEPAESAIPLAPVAAAAVDDIPVPDARPPSARGPIRKTTARLPRVPMPSEGEAVPVGAPMAPARSNATPAPFRPARPAQADPERSLLRSMGMIAIVAVVIVGVMIAFNFASRVAGPRRGGPPPTSEPRGPTEEPGPTEADREAEAADLHRKAADHMHGGRWSEARAALDKLQIEYALTRYAIDHGGEVHGALETCYKALAHARAAAATGRWESAETAFSEGRYQEARGVYREIAQAESDKGSLEIKIANERARHCDEELNVEELWSEAVKAFEGRQWEVVDGAAKKLFEKHGGSHTVKRRTDEIVSLRERANREIESALALEEARSAAEEKRWPQAEAALRRLEVEFAETATVANEKEAIASLRAKVGAAVTGANAEAAAAHLAKAREAFDKGDYEGARRLYEEALQKFGQTTGFKADEVRAQIAAADGQILRRRELRAAHAYALAKSFARTEEWDKALQAYQTLLVDYAETEYVKSRRPFIESARDAAAESKKAKK